MKSIIKVSAAVAALALAGVLHVGAAQAAPADGATSGQASADVATRGTTVVVAGGVWSYGVGGGKVFSAYDNQRLEHRTSVRSSGITAGTSWIRKGVVAYKERPSAWSGNQAFWDAR